MNGLFPNLGLSPKELMAIKTKDVKKPDPGSLSRIEIKIIHNCIKIVSSYCDGAQADDHRGFNKADSDFGRSLASQSWLSRPQAAAGALMIWKYRRQLAPVMVEALGGILIGEKKENNQTVAGFKIIPEFYKGKCILVNIVKLPEWKGVFSFKPEKYAPATEVELVKIGLKKVDMTEIYGILQLEVKTGKFIE